MERLELNPPESVSVTQSDVELLEQHRNVGVSPAQVLECNGENFDRGFGPLLAYLLHRIISENQYRCVHFRTRNKLE